MENNNLLNKLNTFTGQALAIIAWLAHWIIILIIVCLSVSVFVFA